MGQESLSCCCVLWTHCIMIFMPTYISDRESSVFLPDFNLACKWITARKALAGSLIFFCRLCSTINFSASVISGAPWFHWMMYIYIIPWGDRTQEVLCMQGTNFALKRYVKRHMHLWLVSVQEARNEWTNMSAMAMLVQDVWHRPWYQV